MTIPEYNVELWDSSGVFIADISHILAGELSVEIALNDAEDVEFSIDLVQFETLCASIGATPRNILDPYRTDVKIRRNGEYLCGAQVVRVQANFNDQETNKILVQCMGYLNLFKDRFVTASYINKTYAEIAWGLINDTQAQTHGDFGVTLGVDEASANQEATRERNYDLQNVKQGILNLQKLESDNFDHIFSHNKEISFYSRLGSDRPEIQFVYPRNIRNASVLRDANTLANKIYGLGSGFGDDFRFTETAIDNDSALVYRVRERVEQFNSVITPEVLARNTEAALQNHKDMIELPVLSIVPNEIDLNTVQIGDAVTIKIEGSTFIANVDGLYRIIGIVINWNVNGEENVLLRVQQWQ